MKLTHLGISHFRSIGETPVMIDLSKKITVLVGQNDCGKSNVLRGMSFLSGMPSGRNLGEPSSLDYHFNRTSEPPKAYIQGIPTNQDDPKIARVGVFSASGPAHKSFNGKVTRQCFKTPDACI